MNTWTARSTEEAFLLNPAFCSSVLRSGIGSYADDRHQGMPFPMLFMVLPVVLHKATREALPPSTTTSLAAWMQLNPAARVSFWERLMSLKPYTQEALIFGSTAHWFTFTAQGSAEVGAKAPSVQRILSKFTVDARECVLKARMLGKSFSECGDLETAMNLWGIRP